MMRLCDTCFFMRKEHDEFRQLYDDIIIEDADPRQKHYCPMYSDHIPHSIYYDGANCEYFMDDTDEEDHK